MCLLGIKTVHQDHELLAAKAREKIVLPDLFTEEPCGAEQYPIANLVAACVIDGLEVVEVQDGEYEGSAGSLAFGDPFLQRAIERATVGNSSQPIQRGFLAALCQAVLE